MRRVKPAAESRHVARAARRNLKCSGIYMTRLFVEINVMPSVRHIRGRAMRARPSDETHRLTFIRLSGSRIVQCILLAYNYVLFRRRIPTKKIANICEYGFNATYYMFASAERANIVTAHGEPIYSTTLFYKKVTNSSLLLVRDMLF